jgi:hypothetical protein
MRRVYRVRVIEMGEIQMSCRKILAAFMAVAGLVCANSGYAKQNVGAKTEQESSIAIWFSALFSARTDSKKLGISAEPPTCYAKSGKMASNNDRCGEEESEERQNPCKLDPNGKGCVREQQPCAGRQCIEPEPGP